MSIQKIRTQFVPLALTIGGISLASLQVSCDPGPKSSRVAGDDPPKSETPAESNDPKHEQAPFQESAAVVEADSPPKTVTDSMIPIVKYVTAEIAEERLGPSSESAVTNRVYSGQKVTVYEIVDGWERVSPYYDGHTEGVTEQVARWIDGNKLGDSPPIKRSKIGIVKDSRIALPTEPKYGLSERDVLVLYAAAKYYLEIGKATKVEDGDKSVSRPGVYYLNFGGPTNTFFRPSDIPELERRIQELKQ